MNKETQRKGDFTPKYYNAQEINDSQELKPAEKVCELVKHYSMCLFGIATDIRDFYGQLQERDIKINQLTEENKKLFMTNKKLRLQIKVQDEEPQKILDEIAGLKIENKKLKLQVTGYTTKLANIERNADNSEILQKYEKERQRVIYWQERAKELEAKNSALMQRKGAGGNDGE